MKISLVGKIPDTGGKHNISITIKIPAAQEESAGDIKVAMRMGRPRGSPSTPGQLAAGYPDNGPEACLNVALQNSIK